MVQRKIKIHALPNTPDALFIKEAMSLFPPLEYEIATFGNGNDENKATSKDGELSTPTPKDLSEALLGSKDGIAVFLPKDVPYPLPQGLKLLALIEVSSKKLAVLGNTATTEFDALFGKADITQKYGQVDIVGNGPGSKDFLTIKGYNQLSKADVILHDDLIEDAFLDEFEAEKIYVGKRAGYHSKEQHEIDEMMLELATEGKHVVRLKGGDPSLYGHLAEEIYTLESNFVKVEVIPGITSALAAAAFAQAPLTIRNISNSVTFCMAHIKNEVPTPDSGTIVYFMSAANAKLIAQKLIAKGKKPETPVCMVYNVGHKDEKVFRETLQSVLDSDIKYPTPLLIIVGENGNKANFHKALTKESRVLYTGTQPEKYKHLGRIVHHPLIQIAPLGDNGEVKKAIPKINLYDWLIFTSKYAVQHFFEQLFNLGKDVRYLQKPKICSIGRVTSAALRQFGIVPDLEPEKDSSAGILEVFEKNKIEGIKVLLPRSDKALPALPNGLRAMGNDVDSLVIYQNVKPQNIKPEDLNKFDKIVFTSPSGIKNFFEIYKEIPEHLEVITRGNETQKALDNEIKGTTRGK